jgi:CheY-like chemotaxis protein
LRPQRALIVDDEPETCKLIERVLNSLGLESLSVTESTEASRVLRSGKFDVIFVDDHMHFPGGPELVRQIRDSGHNQRAPIILMSDDRETSAMTRGFEAGASFFLYKPIDKERLLKLMRATQGAIELGLRRTRRVPFKSKVTLRIGVHEIEAQTIDISMEGMLVRAARTLPVGSSVAVYLQFGDGIAPIVGEGSIVRIHERNQMGIHLARLTPSDSQRLQEFLLPLVPDASLH